MRPIFPRCARGGAHQYPPPPTDGGACARCARIISARSAARSYDIIVSNPPYVGRRELQGLPAEYRPRAAAGAGGRRGRTGFGENYFARRSSASESRRDPDRRGWQFGDRALRRAFPRLPFIWLAFRARRRRGICAWSASSCHRRGVTNRRLCRVTRIGRLFAVTTLRREPRAGARLHRRWLSAGAGARVRPICSATSIGAAPAPRNS